MALIKRFFFFILTNVAVVAVLMTIVSLFGLESYLSPAGLNYASLAIFATIIGFTGSFISLWMSKWMAKRMMGVKIIESPSNDLESWLLQATEHIAQQAGFKMPEVGIYESKEINAFATGASKNNSLVAFSRGLLEAMNRDEIEGVLAHEMAHIKNGDMVTMTLIQGVVNTFVVFGARAIAYFVQMFLRGGDEEGGVGGMVYWGISILLEIVFGILASVVVFSFSRWREYGADRGSAQFVGKNKMIAALQFLKKHKEMVGPRQRAFATMKISDRPGFMALFSTHPPLEKRIAVLQQAPIH